ncbi:MAG: DUF3341 domain-containing protein [Desulfohalobiaceae bacterium]|nr:DUF3341 domain-containing protein [Desulfohalobiaceae bacterium]
MHTQSTCIMGLFEKEDQAVQAVKSLKDSSYTFLRAYSPFPSSKILQALGLKTSRVGLFTLIGGIIGFFSGYGLALFTATRWELIVGGKPVAALIPFLIVGFEFTILFAVFGNIIGLLTLARLPDLKGLEHYDPRCSGERFGVLAGCPAEQTEALLDFFRQQGADTKTFEPGSKIPS